MSIIFGWIGSMQGGPRGIGFHHHASRNALPQFVRYHYHRIFLNAQLAA